MSAILSKQCRTIYAVELVVHEPECNFLLQEHSFGHKQAEHEYLEDCSKEILLSWVNKDLNMHQFMFQAILSGLFILLQVPVSDP